MWYYIRERQLGFAGSGAAGTARPVHPLLFAVYWAHLVSGSFISLLILFAMDSVTVQIVTITLKLREAPIEAVIFMAAILGFYSRVAQQVLDNIVKAVFQNAWHETHPVPSLAVDPPRWTLKAGETEEFSVESTRTIRWWLRGPGALTEMGAQTTKSRYKAPDEITESISVLLMAETADPEGGYRRGKAEITLVGQVPDAPAAQAPGLAGGLRLPVEPTPTAVPAEAPNGVDGTKSS